MISESLRRKLEEINRGPLHVRDRRVPAESGPSRTLSIEGMVGAREVLSGGGRFLLIERRVEEIFPEVTPILKPFRDVFVGGRHNPPRRTELASDWGKIITTDARQLVFLDVETLGLGAAPVFLVGMMTYDGKGLKLEQLLSRDYSEEPHMLAHLARMLSGNRVLVTFNGKAFDWPTLCERAAANRVGKLPECFHFDLLHEVRRRFKKVLPNCKLQTVEYHVCRRRRCGDIPGMMIPEVYHEFVRTGDATRMKNVLHHNALDVITMAEVLSFLAAGGELVWGD